MIGNILLLGYLLPMVVSYFIMLYSIYAYKENNYSNEGLTVLSLIPIVNILIIIGFIILLVVNILSNIKYWTRLRKFRRRYKQQN